MRLQVGMKRGRSQIEQLDQDEAGEPRKKLRLGTPTCQWITVYNAHAPMKQRYGSHIYNMRETGNRSRYPSLKRAYGREISEL